MSRECRDITTKELDLTGVGGDLADQLIDEGRLSSTVWADHCMYLALNHIQINVVADEVCAEALYQPMGL